MSATVNIAELPADAQARVLKQISQQSVAEQQIAAAWKAYQTVEPRGLDFGKVLYEWQQKLKGGIGRKGGGLSPMLETLNIPSSTAYFWIQRFKEANGLVEVDVPNPERKDESPSQSTKSTEPTPEHEIAQRLNEQLKAAGVFDVSVSPSKDGKFKLIRQNMSEEDIVRIIESHKERVAGASEDAE